jgi:hypothetical protein
VEESLRQIILWNLDPNQWWKYIEHFHANCLQGTSDVFLNSSKLQHCSDNALVMAGINMGQLNAEYNNSFLGGRKEVDDNTYLLEERQLFIREQVNTHPVVLVNKKAQAVDAAVLQERVCKMEGDSPTQFCIVSEDQFSSAQVLIILAVIVALFISVAALYRLYMHIRMRREIKT